MSNGILLNNIYIGLQPKLTQSRRQLQKSPQTQVFVALSNRRHDHSSFQVNVWWQMGQDVFF